MYKSESICRHQNTGKIVDGIAKFITLSFPSFFFSYLPVEHGQRGVGTDLLCQFLVCADGTDTLFVTTYQCSDRMGVGKQGCNYKGQEESE